ncbi:NAD(P)-dependent alcohol dehydrogenase [Aeromicrobium ginsengisoli]|uniref:NAD(P)-dependent alcohol dehydrogenase n=1 Tax=Aeromicrobium ginsengisoli TaxID=363867 RepID=A0A5M4FDI8_9ACTN|nr:NAD(P)-dependent alcohol dehydrogenase [Aeromicrobium ginsengisoli]KAA1395992.1 NAD(P)-dependent alcohol dehydrogenase [Aeromicrobium ginsengisoli]
MRIRAALVRDSDGDFTVEEVDLREPRAGEVLVKLAAVGICHTDLAIKSSAGNGATPVILGHEGSGVVERIGAGVTGMSVGDHVILTFASCGACDLCTRSKPTYCAHFAALNSGGLTTTHDTAHTQEGRPVRGGFFGQSSFATHVIASPANAIVVPRDLDLATIAPLGCAIQTGAGSMLNLLRPGAGSSVLITGLGGVGMAALMAAVASGATTVVAVDPLAARRDVAESLGATLTRAPSADLVAEVLDHTGGGATHALDTTGRADAIGQAFGSLARTGHLVLVGLGMPDLVLPGSALMSGGRSVTGSIEGDAVPHDLIPVLARMYREGSLPLDRIVRNYAFDDINQAVADMRAGDVIKPVLVFD